MVECLKLFKGMLWGQTLRVFADHKNLVRSGLAYTCDHVYRWRFVLEKYGTEIDYIKGAKNTVTASIIQPDFDSGINTRSVSV